MKDAILEFRVLEKGKMQKYPSHHYQIMKEMKYLTGWKTWV